jgi:hypothetical protein
VYFDFEWKKNCIEEKKCMEKKFYGILLMQMKKKGKFNCAETIKKKSAK